MSQIENIRKYWNMRAEGYSRQNRDELKDQSRKIEEKILKYAPKKEGLKVLDLGCGPGIFSIILAKKGYKVTAVDYSEEMIAEAKKNAEALGTDITFYRMDAQHLEFDSETFDMIVTRNMMWCLENPRHAYEEWIRVLKNGGIIINCDGNYYLDYYDEGYREAVRQAREASEKMHKEYITDDIDVEIINNIARELPLSKIKRPEWDFEVLAGSGMTKIQTELYDLKKVKTKEGIKYYADSFLIAAEKNIEEK